MQVGVERVEGGAGGLAGDGGDGVAVALEGGDVGEAGGGEILIERGAAEEVGGRAVIDRWCGKGDDGGVFGELDGGGWGLGAWRREDPEWEFGECGGEWRLGGGVGDGEGVDVFDEAFAGEEVARELGGAGAEHEEGFVVGFGGFVGGEVEAAVGGALVGGPLGGGGVGNDGEGLDGAGTAAEGVVDVFVEGGEEAGVDVGDGYGDAEEQGGVGFGGVFEHRVNLLLRGAEGGAGGEADVVFEVEGEAFIEEEAVDAGLRGEIGEIVGDGGGLLGELCEPAGFGGGARGEDAFEIFAGGVLQGGGVVAEIVGADVGELKGDGEGGAFAGGESGGGDGGDGEGFEVLGVVGVGAEGDGAGEGEGVGGGVFDEDGDGAGGFGVVDGGGVVGVCPGDVEGVGLLGAQNCGGCCAEKQQSGKSEMTIRKRARHYRVVMSGCVARKRVREKVVIEARDC